MSPISHRPRVLTLILVAGLALSLSGCGKMPNMGDTFRSWFGLRPKVQDAVSEPQALARQGMEEMEADNYKDAAETFRKLRDQYPYSEYALVAELKVGDAYFQQGKYLEALAAYEDFERLHPQNEAVPYAVYQQGMCHFGRLKGLDRDQTPTMLTLQTFTRLIETYPQSPYAAMAQARIIEAQTALAGHEFYVGEFYYKKKNYQAALNRFVGLVRYYPNSGYHEQALILIADCQDKIAKEDEDKPEDQRRAKFPLGSATSTTGFDAPASETTTVQSPGGVTE